MTVSEEMVERARVAYEAALDSMQGGNEPISISEIRSRGLRAALNAALSDQVVVPKEPTDEMICAGDERIIEALQHHELIAATPTPAEKCYRAMIAAAPASTSGEV